MRTQARSLPGTQPPSVREAGEVERGGEGWRWWGVRRDSNFFLWSWGVSFSIKGAMYCSGVTQLLLSSGTRPTSSSSRSSSSRLVLSQGNITALSLSLSLSIQAAGYQLRKDKRWVSQMRHYTHLFLECVECCVCVILPKIKTLNCAPGGKGYTSGWGIECECKWSLIFYFEKSVLCY